MGTRRRRADVLNIEQIELQLDEPSDDEDYQLPLPYYTPEDFDVDPNLPNDDNDYEPFDGDLESQEEEE